MPRKKAAKKGKGTMVRKWSGKTRFSASNARPRTVTGSKTTKRLYVTDPVRRTDNQYAPLLSLVPVPQRKSFVLRYAESGPTHTGLAVGVAGVGGTEIAYALNALFDPNISGVGHQPFYYDQMVNCGYQRYRVDRVSIKIRAIGPTNTNTGLQVQIDAWNGAAGTLTGISWNTANERPQNWWLQPGTTIGVKELELERLPIHMLQGMTANEYYNAESYSAAVTANPARGPYLRLAAMNQAGDNAGEIDCTVELTFFGEFFDRQLPSAS